MITFKCQHSWASLASIDGLKFIVSDTPVAISICGVQSHKCSLYWSLLFPVSQSLLGCHSRLASFSSNPSLKQNESVSVNIQETSVTHQCAPFGGAGSSKWTGYYLRFTSWDYPFSVNPICLKKIDTSRMTPYGNPALFLFGVHLMRLGDPPLKHLN